MKSVDIDSNTIWTADCVIFNKWLDFLQAYILICKMYMATGNTYNNYADHNRSFSVLGLFFLPICLSLRWSKAMLTNKNFIYVYSYACVHVHICPYMYISLVITRSYKKLKYPFSKYFKNIWKNIITGVTFEKFSVNPDYIFERSLSFV